MGISAAKSIAFVNVSDIDFDRHQRVWRRLQEENWICLLKRDKVGAARVQRKLETLDKLACLTGGRA